MYLATAPHIHQLPFSLQVVVWVEVLVLVQVLLWWRLSRTNMLHSSSVHTCSPSFAWSMGPCCSWHTTVDKQVLEWAWLWVSNNMNMLHISNFYIC